MLYEVITPINMKANNILETIGNTPVVKINKLFGADKNVFIIV